MVPVRKGDAIECDVKHPLPGVITCRLDSQEAVDCANDLLASDSAWRPKRLLPVSTTLSCSCRTGECVHKLLDDRCPDCGSNMMEVTATGFRFCSNHEFWCEYEEDV